MTNCQVKVNGSIYEGWKGISLTRSVEAISSFFSFEFSDMWTPDGNPWPLNPQDEIEIFFDGYSLVRGYIDVLTATLQENDRTYTIQGRDKTSDLVDCSCPISPRDWLKSKITFIALAESLTRFIDVDIQLGPGDYNRKPIAFRVDNGETIFDALDRAAGKIGALLVPDGRGGLIVTDRGQTKAVGRLVEGENAKDMSFTKDYSDRYSDYTVEGSSPGKNSAGQGTGWYGKKKDGGTSLPSAGVKDLGMRRYRPLYIQNVGQNDSEVVKNRAEFEAVTRAAKSLRITCTVQGWMQAPGLPWLINEMVQVFAPRLGLGNASGDEYLISETEYTLSLEGGEITKMTLLPREAFLQKPKVDKQKRDQQGVGWFSAHNDQVKVYPGSAKPKPNKGLAH